MKYLLDLRISAWYLWRKKKDKKKSCDEGLPPCNRDNFSRILWFFAPHAYGCPRDGGGMKKKKKSFYAQKSYLERKSVCERKKSSRSNFFIFTFYASMFLFLRVCGWKSFLFSHSLTHSLLLSFFFVTKSADKNDEREKHTKI